MDSHTNPSPYLAGADEKYLIEHGAIHTAREISQQPQVWKKIAEIAIDQQEPLDTFLRDACMSVRRIIITGAGTSAFIGLSLRGIWQRTTGIPAEAISTTDLVTHPFDLLQSHENILLISFARSGNSPESMAALRVADSICAKCFHLIITCNSEGDLAKCVTPNSKYILTLPPETNDQSLAMTSSYTGMLLAGLLVAKTFIGKKLNSQVELLSEYANNILHQHIDLFRKIAAMPFDRAVFLGSGPLQGTAVESHLKLQELTDGKVICKSDSFLGFRHGPKAVVNENTLMVYLFSNQAYVERYEMDLVNDMQRGQKPLRQIGIAESNHTGLALDQLISLSNNGNELDEDFLPVIMVLPAQMIGFFKSLHLGLSPDNPSASGAISRVVQGVKIYPLEMQIEKTSLIVSHNLANFLLMNKFDVLVVGELNVDLILGQLDQLPVLEKEILAKEMVLTLGSSSAIFASNLSALGNSVAFCGKIGTDLFGELVLTSLREKHVNCDFIIQSKEYKTGCTVAMTIGHKRAMVTHAGAMEELSETEIANDMLNSAEHLHVSSAFLQPKLKPGLASLFLRAKNFGLTTSLDPQWDPEEKWDLPLQDLLTHLDVFLPNAAELKGLTKTSEITKGIGQLREYANTIVVKDNTNGAWCSTHEEIISHAAFLNSNPVDAIGAGDSFDVGFIHQFIRGKTPKECLRFASLMGAVNTTAPGGTGAFENIEAVKEQAAKYFGETI